MRGSTPIGNSTSEILRNVFRVSCILGLTLWSGGLSGQEGNYKFDNFGNQSVLLNGNVTGSVADLGLVYYNPARLGLIENPSFTIGGKAYEWSKFYFDNILQTDKSLSANRFGGLPATLAGTFNLKFLPDHKFAYSIISRHRSDIRLRYDSGLSSVFETPNIPDAEESFTELEFRDRLRDDWFGVTWAYPVSETFSVGVSLFGSIYEHNGRGDVLINVRRETGDVVTYTNRLDYNQKTYGGQIKAGVAWISGDLEMGVNVSFPFIAVKQRASFNYQESLSGFSSGQDFIIALDYGDLESKRKTPAGIAYGVGIPWKNHKIHLDLSWYAGIGSYDRIKMPEEVLEELEENPFKEELRSVINFGVGGNFSVSPSLNIIGSFSSDFSASVESINLFDVINQSDEDINLLNNLWHFAVGVDFSRPWGNITLGTSYARTGSNIGSAPIIPEDGNQAQPRSIATQINYERWRFIVGLEIPLIMEKLKDLPIPIN
ncbi:MAG: hypothetical protein R3252_01405 [Robiginitalea sp.]|nr:hypothetical protein [Robiginitalea sp.]